jgi:OmpA-OmpF porin, OOP family
MSTKVFALSCAALCGLALPSPLLAQPQDSREGPITVTGMAAPDTMAIPDDAVPGPEIKGIITARKGGKMRVVTSDGSSVNVQLAETTRIKAASGLFGGNRGNLTSAALLNGLPVTIKTLQSGAALFAAQITFRNNDLKTANMIRNGTAQQFEEQAAATAALRGRMADIDQYNIKQTTNVFFDTGKAVLSPAAKADLCATAAQGEAMNNALMLVVGYTDSTGSDEINQALSEKRAGAVINYLQQACRWKPYRMLTPTGMATADPLASNETEEGKAQNRRVSVNILVSKSVDGF